MQKSTLQPSAIRFRNEPETPPPKRKPEIIVLDDDSTDGKTNLQKVPVLESKNNVPMSVGQPNLPPRFLTKTYLSQTQYVNPSGISSLAITRGGLGCSPGAITIVANASALGIASSFRLISVRIWLAPSIAGGSAAEASIEWVGNTAEQALGKDEATERAIPSGVVMSSALTFRPPKGSWHSMWQFANDNTSDVLFFLKAIPLGSVIQVNMEFTLATQQAGVSFVQGSTAAALFGYPALDLPTTRQVRPISLLKEIF